MAVKNAFAKKEWPHPFSIVLEQCVFLHQPCPPSKVPPYRGPVQSAQGNVLVPKLFDCNLNEF